MTIRGYSPLALLTALLVVAGQLSGLLGVLWESWWLVALGGLQLLAAVPTAVLSVLDG